MPQFIAIAETDPSPQAVDTFTAAALRWHSLSADQSKWSGDAGHRELAAAFLRYHAAKLALEEVTSGCIPA